MSIFRRRRTAEFGWFAHEPIESITTESPEQARPIVTIEAHERAVAYKRGAFLAVLQPGRHAVGFSVSLRRVDVRDRREQLAPQDVPTADGALVRITASFGWRISDARAFVERSADPIAEVYLAIQIALREALIGREVDEIASAPRLDKALVARLTDEAQVIAEPLGIEVNDLVIKDIITPSEWRRAQFAVKVAKLDGLAKLEAARAETAALRALANQAKLLEDNPEFAKLQLMKAAASSGRLELSYQPFA